MERSHRTVSQGIKALLFGAGLDVKFWPYAFIHVLRIRNALPGQGQDASPSFLSTGKKDNFRNLRIFGCRVWVQPTGLQKKRFKDNVRKGIFLGYVPHTDRLIMYYDCESERVKITSYCKFDEGFNDLPIESVPLGFQQLVRANRDEPISSDDVDISSSDLDFFVYPFADKQIINVPIQSNNKDKQFGLQLQDDDLYDPVYIEEIKNKSSVAKAFNKSTLKQLKGSFITHIDGDPVFNTKDATKKLEKLYSEYLSQDQGVAGKKQNFSFSLTFAPEDKLLGIKLKKAIDEYNGYTSGTTKTIKSKPEELPYMADVDDDSDRFITGTKVFKVFNDVEYKGTVTGYDHKKNLYHILYEDGDAEDYYRNEVPDLQAEVVKRHPKRKRWKKKTSKMITNSIKNFAPTDMELEEHIMSLSIEDIRAIATVRHESAISSEMIQLCINTLNSDHMTKEEQALGYFTRKRLKRLATWQEWKDGETKQLNQFHQQKMFGQAIDPITLTEVPVVL